MDTSPNQTPNLNLPPIGGELGPTNLNPELAPRSDTPEKITTPESSLGQGLKSPPQAVPILPVYNPIPTTQPTIAQDQPTDNQPIAISDESRDLIAKEWITRAKRIVSQTRDDPYKQSQEFNKLKAEYVKRRYNMTIKVNNE